MHILPVNLAALAVAGLFYTWRAYRAALLQREHTLRERVAHMLWVAAEWADSPGPYKGPQIGESI